MKYGLYLEEQLVDFPKDWRDHFISYSSLKDFIKQDMAHGSVNLFAILPQSQSLAWKPPVIHSKNSSNGYDDDDEDEEDENGDDDRETQSQSFDQLVGSRLSSLAEMTPKFCRMLDKEIEHMNACYERESESLCHDGQRALKDLKVKLNTNINILDCRNAGTATPISVDERDELELVLEGVLLLERFTFLNYTAITKILKKHDKWTGISIREAYMLRTSKMAFVHNKPLLGLKERLMNALAGTTVEALETDDENSTPMSTSNASQINLHAFIAEREAKEYDGKCPIMPLDSGNSSSTSLEDILDSTQTVTITLRGPHGTDIIGAVLDSCTKFRCRILDFSLSRVHHHVSFGVVVKIPASDVGLFNHLADNARKWDATLTFDVQNARLRAKQLAYGTKYRLDEAPYENRKKYAATVLKEDGLTPIFLDEWCKWLLANKISIERMKRLDSLAQLRCVEFLLSVPKSLDLTELRRELFALSSKHQTDVALQPDNVFRRQKRLVVFDMDSTLIQQEVIDEIARGAGIVDKVAAITESAMRGEIDFKQSLLSRVALLKNTPTDVIDKVKRRLVFTEGARHLCRALKKAGFKLAVISGGFLPLAQYVKNELGLDYAFANQLKTTPDGKYLTGETIGPIVDADRKAELLDVIAQAENIIADQVVAVGDGANDLKMLARASLGIAFNAKPRVQQQARARINQSSLVSVLHLMGFSETEATELYM